MFKWASIEKELYSSMKQNLVKAWDDRNNDGMTKLAHAADLLNEAANIFDKAGMYAEADEIAIILQSMAQEIK
jgi:putative methionine-R-sulfoxide reductase with GAF domain